MSTHELFIILDYISILIMFVCVFIISTHYASHMQKLAMLVCISLTMCCIGFLFRAEAVRADSYILGQKLIYAFVTHGMFLMLLFIIDYCRFTIPRVIKRIFIGINFVITFVVLTLDYHTLFYKSYWAIDRGGYCILQKEYGFMHSVAVALFFFYMLAAVAVTLVYTCKNFRKRTKYVGRILVAVMLPCISYIIPKITGSNNDFQPLAFAAFSVMVLYMIYKNNLYDIENIAARFSIDALDEALIVFDNEYHYKGCNKQAESLFPELKNINIDSDIRDTYPEFLSFVDDTIPEYHKDELIYEVKVCPIKDSSISQGKVIKLEDVTIQRRYTELLQSRKESLESEVVTLTNYSYTDELTGLNNRRCFEDMLVEIREKKLLEDLVVCSVDINGLKQVNDNNCHAAGDELIVATADIISRIFSPYGRVFRTGGDEFYIIMTSAPDRLEELINQTEKSVKGWRGKLARSLSLSYGFAYGRDGNSADIDELLIEADKMMYANKRIYYAQPGRDRRQD